MKISKLLAFLVVVLVLFLTCQSCFVCLELNHLEHQIEGGQ